MEFDGFDWDDGNVRKCEKHGLSIDDIESVFADDVIVIPDLANSALEDRHRAVGRTAAGRHAFIVFTMRGGLVRPLSARFMHRREVSRYEKDNTQVRER